MEKKDQTLFTPEQIIILTAAFVGIVIVIQRSFRYISEHLVAFDCPYYWPVSVFNFRFPTAGEGLAALAVAAIFFVLIWLLEKRRPDLVLVVAAGILLIAGTTTIQGLQFGFYAPIAGDAQTGVLVPNSLEGQEYYHDAVKVTDPVDFFRRYNEIQPTLNRHSHTHPPGAVLTFYFLAKVLKDPALIGLFIMITATAVSIYYFYRILLTELRVETAGFTAFLFVLLPAVQIYFLASIDALIVALLTGTLYYFCFAEGVRGPLLAALLLVTSFMLTFVSLFILPVLVGFELLVRRSLRRSITTIVVVVAVYFSIYFLTGYDAWHAFRTASHYENPNGFMLFVDPWNYFFTRIEDVGELIFFFGPFLFFLLIKGLKGFSWQAEYRTRPLFVLSALACFSVLGMYAVGAWRTGETARACAFIYPYLLIPVGRYLEDNEIAAGGRMQLAALVFFQSVAMQVFGNYFW